MLVNDSSSATKQRKPRPSRSRGLRTTAGCLTCRKRRLKCDEVKPECSGCLKSKRECVWQANQASTDPDDAPASSPASELPEEPSHRRRTSGVSHTEPKPSQSFQARSSRDHNESRYDEPTTSSNQRGSTVQSNSITSPNIASPLTTSSLTPGAAPFYWYDLLAEDAIYNLDNYDFLKDSGTRWFFEEDRHSRRPSIHGNLRGNASATTSAQNPGYRNILAPQLSSGGLQIPPGVAAPEPWNFPVAVTSHEWGLIEHYIKAVAPILDLFDPQEHFGKTVVHLSLQNEGLLKSILALAALHRSRYPLAEQVVNPIAGSLSDSDLAVQYYYETLNYLSQAMQYQGYAYSQEIVANAALISSYEAIMPESSSNWERHLKGVFWIQRSQDNDGEKGGLRQAVWWNWLRQDIWAAFRHSRKTLTIWRPKKLLHELSADELACKVLFIQAKIVGYASDEARQTRDFMERIEEGDILLQALEDWYKILPSTFEPVPTPTDDLHPEASKSHLARPIWIHPPMYAAAIQVYYSSKILVLLNKPSLGGRQTYYENQQVLDDCLLRICGIAMAPNSSFVPLATATFQALFVAGQCARTGEQQQLLLQLLEQTRTVIKIRSPSMLEELRKMWGLT